MKRSALLSLFFAFLCTALCFAQIGTDLQQKLENARDTDYIPVLVAYKASFDVENIMQSFEIQGDEESVKLQTIEILKKKAEESHFWLKSFAQQRSTEAKDFYSFWITNMVALKATPAAIREIAAQPDVQEVILDEEKNFLDYQPGVPMRDAWGLGKIGSKEVNKRYRGKGVLVSVIDTGVNYNHNDLTSRVINGRDCINNDDDSLDDNGHGSHCSGTIAGTTFGVAPEATILAVKVLNGGGSGTWESVAKGVQYTADFIKNGKRVDVASMSLGGRPPIQAVLKTAFNNALKLGVRFAIAAGNSGPGAGSIGTPGDLEAIISVGATDINDAIASFSSRGPVTWNGGSYIKPDVSAPGVNITSCWKGSGTATNTISGTSMATPHVAGLMALVLEAKPGLTNAQVKALLESKSLDLGTPGKDNTFGSGRIAAIPTVGQVALATSSERLEIETEVTFPIGAGGAIAVNITKENPLWEMNVKVQMTVLEPAGTYNATFMVKKAGKPDQTGQITNLPSGQSYTLPRTYTVYEGENTGILNGKYTGSSTVTQGKIRVKVTTVD